MSSFDRPLAESLEKYKSAIWVLPTIKSRIRAKGKSLIERGRDWQMLEILGFRERACFRSRLNFANVTKIN